MAFYRYRATFSIAKELCYNTVLIAKNPHELQRNPHLLIATFEEGYRPNETLHYRAEQSEMNGILVNLKRYTASKLAG